MKPSQIIAQAINHPEYLNGHNYLCSVIARIYENDQMTEDQWSAASEIVYESINKKAFLRDYLRDQGVIAQETRYTDKEYRQAALAHWSKLINKLVAEGQ